jgi:hypothetical protein
MKVSYTEEDIIRFIYNETSPQENEIIREELINNFELRKTYQELLLTLNRLNEVKIQPSQTSINIILEYSQSMDSIKEVQ